MKLIVILMVVVVGVLSFILGGELAPKPIEVLKIVRVEVEKPFIVEREVITEKVSTVFIDKPVYTRTIIIISPEATDEELTLAFKMIEDSRKSHQYYADNPWAQELITGDTEWNIYWVKGQDLLKELLERAYGGIK